MQIITREKKNNISIPTVRDTFKKNFVFQYATLKHTIIGEIDSFDQFRPLKVKYTWI
jgi:hypothetical protein